MGDMRAIAQPETKTKARRTTRGWSLYAERTDQFLCTVTNDRGKPVYFIRANVTGLHDRVLGPFSTRSHAIAAFDRLLKEVLQVFCDLENEGDGGAGVREYVSCPADLKPVALPDVTP